MNTQDEKETSRTGERALTIRISAEDYRRFTVGRAKRGQKTAEFLHYLLDLEEGNAIG